MGESLIRINPPVTTTSIGAVAKGDLVLNVKDYGAVGDGRLVTDGVVTSGSPTLTSATAAFTSADVGKRVMGANIPVVTISSVQSGTSVTLSANATSSATFQRIAIGTDNASAFQACATAATGKRMFIPGGFYVTSATTVIPAATAVEGVGAASTIFGRSLTLSSQCSVRLLQFVGDQGNSNFGIEVPVATAISDCIVDSCTFDNHSRAIYIQRTQDNTTSARLRITNNAFTNHVVGFLAERVNRSNISFNTFTTAQNSAQSILFNAGAENRVIGNDITWGKTGICFLYRRDLASVYSPIFKNVVSNNNIRSISEESISFDLNASGATTTAAVERDTVASKVSTNQVTLTASGWSTAGAAYVNYYAAFLTGALQGHAVKITAQSNGTLTLAISSAQFALLTVGDEIQICLPFMHNVVANNIIDHQGRGTTWSIVLYGNCYENSVVGNSIVGSPLGFRSQTGLVQPSPSYTAAYNVNTVESNACIGNTIEGADLAVDWHDYGGTATRVAIKNTITGNIVQDGKLSILRQKGEVNNNVSGLTADYTGSTVAPSSAIPAAQRSGYYYYCNSSGSSSTSSMTNTAPRCSPWIVETPLSITRLGAEFTAAGDANSTLRIVIWNDDGAGMPGSVLLDAGTISTGTGNAGSVATGGTPGSYEIVLGSTLVLQPGLYWVGGITQNAPTTVPTIRIIQTMMIGQTVDLAIGTTIPVANNSLGGYAGANQSGAAAAFASPAGTNSPPRIFYKVA